MTGLVVRLVSSPIFSHALSSPVLRLLFSVNLATINRYGATVLYYSTGFFTYFYFVLLTDQTKQVLIGRARLRQLRVRPDAPCDESSVVEGGCLLCLTDYTSDLEPKTCQAPYITASTEDTLPYNKGDRSVEIAKQSLSLSLSYYNSLFFLPRLSISPQPHVSVPSGTRPSAGRRWRRYIRWSSRWRHGI